MTTRLNTDSSSENDAMTAYSLSSIFTLTISPVSTGRSSFSFHNPLDFWIPSISFSTSESRITTLYLRTSISSRFARVVWGFSNIKALKTSGCPSSTVTRSISGSPKRVRFSSLITLLRASGIKLRANSSLIKF